MDRGENAKGRPEAEDCKDGQGNFERGLDEAADDSGDDTVEAVVDDEQSAEPENGVEHEKSPMKRSKR